MPEHRTRRGRAWQHDQIDGRQLAIGHAMDLAIRGHRGHVGSELCQFLYEARPAHIRRDHQQPTPAQCAGMNVENIATRAVDRYREHLTLFHRQVDELTYRPLEDVDAKVIIHDAFRSGILPIRFFPAVSETYFQPKPGMTDVEPRTHWGLHNAFTRAIGQMAPGPAFQATTELGRFFGLVRPLTPVRGEIADVGDVTS